jgi:hypothetical protein
MSKLLKCVGVSVFAVSLALSGCGGGGGGGGGGGDSPKALAKQTYELSKKYDKGKNLPKSGPEYDAYMAKFKVIMEKYNQWSPEDKKIYDEEIKRLAGDK